jgi:hypothetical protein
MKVIGVVACLVLLGGCAAWTVKSETSPNAQLGRYQAYQWLASPAADVDRLAEQQIRDQVARQLALKGIHPAAPGEAPDFLIGYRLESGPRAQTIVNDTNFYAPGASGASSIAPFPASATYVYQEQALVLDFIDAGSGRVFWRGYASYVLDKPAPVSATKAQQAAAKIMGKYL